MLYRYLSNQPVALQYSPAQSAGRVLRFSMVGFPDGHHWWREEDAPFDETKNVVNHQWKYKNRYGPTPDVVKLCVRTKDGWNYVFHELQPGEGFELIEKWDSTGVRSDDDIVPVTVARYIESNDDLEPKDGRDVNLNYAKLVVRNE